MSLEELFRNMFSMPVCRSFNVSIIHHSYLKILEKIIVPLWSLCVILAITCYYHSIAFIPRADSTKSCRKGSAASMKASVGLQQNNKSISVLILFWEHVCSFMMLSAPRL